MTGIQGLGGVPDPRPERVDKAKNERERTSALAGAPAEPRQDEVVVSEQARAAVEVSRAVQAARSQTDIRAERIEAAKQAIERGDYKNPEIVAKVAERLARILG